MKLLPLSQPQIEFKSLLDVFEKALAQEQQVTGQINKLYELAFEQKAFAALVELDGSQMQLPETAAQAAAANQKDFELERATGPFAINECQKPREEINGSLGDALVEVIIQIGHCASIEFPRLRLLQVAER